MKCTIAGCPGVYEHHRVSQTYKIDGKLVVVSDIPARVCSVCGDTLLDSDTSRRIEALIRDHGPADEMAPVYRLKAG